MILGEDDAKLHVNTFLLPYKAELTEISVGSAFFLSQGCTITGDMSNLLEGGVGILCQNNIIYDKIVTILLLYLCRLSI